MSHSWKNGNLTSKCKLHSESTASQAIPTNVAGDVSFSLLSNTGECESLASANGLGASLPLTRLGSVLVATFRANSPAYNCSSSRGLSLSNVPDQRHRQGLLTLEILKNKSSDIFAASHITRCAQTSLLPLWTYCSGFLHTVII
jgi:hypothetical protein